MRYARKVRNMMNDQNNCASWRDIPYSTLTFCLRFHEPVRLPEQKVSALRGGLGEMLLRQHCIADRKCEICRFQESCIVWNAFYTPMRFKPDYVTGKESLGYLIECDNEETDMDEDHGFAFRLRLFGRNIPLFSQYLNAFWQLGRVGLGKEHARFEIAAIVLEDDELLMDENGIYMDRFQVRTVGDYVDSRLQELEAFVNADTKEKLETGYVLHFMRPLALRKDRVDLHQFDADAIWRAVHRKIQMMSYFSENPIEPDKPPVWPQILDARTEKFSVKRYSNTHKHGMELKGIRGAVLMEPMKEERLSELLAGELFHIGRNSSFDFGRYQVYKNRE